MSQQTVLVIDDERDIRELLTITLGRMDLQVHAVGTVAEARRALDERSYDLCFTDMRLPDGNGQEVIELIADEHPDTPVAMITAYGNVDAAVNALKAGAFDFVSKPVDIQMLRRLVRTALKLAEEKRAGGNDAPDAAASGSRLIGDSLTMQQVRVTIGKLARNQAPVYIAGESGVGKELVARLIHEQGPRTSGPFVPVNCGAIPSELMESEFFGHRKGSFTGAGADKEGLFQAANGGTLFLDEVAELPLHMQVKLLRAIQEKAVRPIGAREEIPVDVRILSATHKNLAALVEQGLFRQDLFYRINVIELRVPPLRERRGDVPLLSAFILKQLAAKNGGDEGRLQADARQALEAYDFPGNVRELENILERAMAMCDGDSITATDLMLPQRAPRMSGEPAPTSPSPAGMATAPAAAASTPDGGLDDYISNLERTAIIKALEESRYNKTAAARKLGITFRALRYKLKKLGID
ncbi:sigma-54-dependent transcriptional regulator [Rhodanobacter glycinis]|uniref:Two-component system, NtrC family, response regulator PilR n=1 Tax=Rhodanobacter glycinis TaxID=582702 RepID=A0A1I4E3Y0_9GAMM|nr:sigma-54 dependent transcriptional regulator [Rhodanobacter glycinis]SFK98871.1 two-component system, NtrC family, response regulator PilR [Rhodanobacter glycinis]